MRFVETPLRDVFVVEPEPKPDERGFFARIWCAETLRARGLDPELVQTSISFNRRAGTLRGMHYQAAPHGETKLVRCLRGAIYDVVVDLREGEPTHGKWFAAELSADNRRMLYIPKGCAHGFQTLVDDSEVEYFISTPYAPDAARGVRWDDPAFGIAWPSADARVISERDRTYPLVAATTDRARGAT